MSLNVQIGEHEKLESTYAMFAVRDMQQGNTFSANHGMEQAAMHRHLAYELQDTSDIAWAAYLAWADEKRAA
ncbi:hypothetical protein [Arthrobacter sp. GMC3]|uniref:hypothetical protein n=1 Tax=Arthrobacter sp. GMC3 TaxID=2058894 RepID=UPI000CE30940|nr:hypothetical protein [Arthrobacter sp. GMC3]